MDRHESSPAPPVQPYRYDREATPYTHPNQIDDAAVAAFHRDGFIAVENMLTLEEVKVARDALTDLLMGRVAGFDAVTPEPEYQAVWQSLTVTERADKARKIWLFCAHESRLRYLAVAHPAITRLLTRLCGEEVRLIQDMALLKPAHIGKEKPWHQDAAYFNWSPPEKIIGIWIALDPATAENGCMHAVPGTHIAGPVPHTHDRDCQIPDAAVAVERDVMVPLKPGGAMLFSALVHHGTPTNTSPSARWALQFHYAGASCVPLSPKEHGALFFEREQYAGCRSPAMPVDTMDASPVAEPYSFTVGGDRPASLR